MANTQDLTEALVAYIEENQARFYRWAYRYVHNETAALDVVHDSIVEALTHIRELRHPDSMRSWFYHILIHESLRAVRHRQRLLPLETLPEKASREQPDAGRAVDVLRAVDNLPPRLRVVVMLRFYEDMTLEEIAVATDANLSTIKSRLYKAMGLLRAALRDYAEEELTHETVE